MHRLNRMFPLLLLRTLVLLTASSSGSPHGVCLLDTLPSLPSIYHPKRLCGSQIFQQFLTWDKTLCGHPECNMFDKQSHSCTVPVMPSSKRGTRVLADLE